MKRRNFISAVGSMAALSACGGGDATTTVTPFIAGTGPSSSQSPYLTPISSAVQFGSILTTGDAVGTYRLGGIPDGLGAYDNGNGSFTLLVNHELGGAVGVARAHGSIGAYVSEWVIDKSSFAVKSGSDLMRNVFTFNAGTSAWDAATVVFSRFCSADLAPVGAFFNSGSGKGSQARIFLNGEESSSATVAAKGVAHIATGTDKGKSFVLPWATMTNVGWENLLAHPSAGDKTLVIGNSDGGNQGVYLYVGAKASTGNDVEKAGLVGGLVYRLNVNSLAVETPETRAADAGLGLVANVAAFSMSTNLAIGTKFFRPEDGAWDTVNTNRYYFVTTDQMDAAKDGNTNPDITAGQVGRTRLWRLTFTDIARPELGGIVELLLDGTETVSVNGRSHGPQMLDNLTVAADGSLILQEDTGNNAHNAKVWRYVPASKTLTLLAQHDVARFGDFFTSATGSLTKDEESSGVIEVTALLGRNDGRKYFILTVQNHQAATGTNAAELVEGGQLLLMSM